MPNDQITEWRVGDRVVAEAHRVGEEGRLGEVIEVIDGSGHPRCRVRWEDGHETLLYSGTDVRLVRRTPKEVA